MTAMIYNKDNAQELEALLVGRRIVEANLDNNKLVLDNGIVLEVPDRDGGCICGAGDYNLTTVSTVDNAITSVGIESNPGGDDLPNYDGYYRIFVMAENKEITVAQWDGTDGNGYYGTGFSVIVRMPNNG